MKKIVLTLLVLLLAFGVTISAKSLQPTSLAPENAQWLIHLDMKKFVPTQLCDLFLKNNTAKFNKFNEMMSEKFQVDLLKDITGITLLGLGKDKHNVVMCWAGNFNKDHLLSLLKTDKNHREIPYGKHTIYSSHGHKFEAFANDQLVLVGGGEDAIRNVLDVIDGKKQNMKASNLMSYWKGIPKDAFLKAAAYNISELAHDRDASTILKKTGMAFFMALERNENLKLKLKLTTDTPETAKNIHQIVMGFMALAKLKQNDKASHKHMKFLELMDHLTITVEKNVLQMELNYPSKDLAELFSHARIGF